MPDKKKKKTNWIYRGRAKPTNWDLFGLRLLLRSKLNSEVLWSLSFATLWLTLHVVSG